MRFARADPLEQIFRQREQNIKVLGYGIYEIGGAVVPVRPYNAATAENASPWIAMNEAGKDTDHEHIA